MQLANCESVFQDQQGDPLLQRVKVAAIFAPIFNWITASAIRQGCTLALKSAANQIGRNYLWLVTIGQPGGEALLGMHKLVDDASQPGGWWWAGGRGWARWTNRPLFAGLRSAPTTYGAANYGGCWEIVWGKVALVGRARPARVVSALRIPAGRGGRGWESGMRGRGVELQTLCSDRSGAGARSSCRRWRATRRGDGAVIEIEIQESIRRPQIYGYYDGCNLAS